MEIATDIAVTHPQGADVWVGMWTLTLRQLFKTHFENIISTYINALTNLFHKALVFYRKSLKGLSKRSSI